MRNAFVVLAFCCALVLSACSSMSGISSAEACRTLKLAKGKVMDLSLRQLGNQNPNNLHEFLPPDEQTVAEWKALSKSLISLADQLGDGEKADLARQFASDVESQLNVYQQGQNSFETAGAISDDVSQIVQICGF